MSAAEIRARLDDAEAWLREEFAPTETELAAFAALRAVLDLCDVEDRYAEAAEERPYLFVTEVRAAIAAALGLD